MGDCICLCVFVCMWERERLHLPFVHFLCPVAGCQMPTPHTHSQSTAGACKCVYYLQSLDSKEQEMSFLFLSPSCTHTHTLPLSLPTPFCFPLSFSPLPHGLPHPLSGHQKRLKEFIRVYFILVLIIFSRPLHYCFCVKAWESKHEKYKNHFFPLHTTEMSMVFP